MPETEKTEEERAAGDSGAEAVNGAPPRRGALTAPDDELNAYAFPDVARRRIGATVYVAIGIGAIAIWAFSSGPMHSGGWLLGGALVLGIGAYVYATGWHLSVSEADALEKAAEALSFAIGPASIAVSWRGPLSKPVWQILAYSHEDPPLRRGLVIIDAVSGDLVDKIDEVNPEKEVAAADGEAPGIGEDSPGS